MTSYDPALVEAALKDPWDTILAAVRAVLVAYPTVSAPVEGRIYVERRSPIQPDELPCLNVVIDREQSPRYDTQAPKVYEVLASLRIEVLFSGDDKKVGKLARRVLRAAQLALEANEELGGIIDRVRRTAREISMEQVGEGVATNAMAEFEVRYTEDAINEANRVLFKPLEVVNGKFVNVDDAGQLLIEALAYPEQD